MKPKHTPGPWSEPRIYADSHGKVFARRIYADGRTICSVDIGPGRDHKANAHLIAAAPELLEALEAITQDAVYNEEWSDLTRVEWDSMMWRASIALFKARGGEA